MIMKKIIFFVATIAALVVTSCSKDNVASDNGVKYVTEFTVDFENSTRVSASYVTGSGLDFMFDDTNLVHVWNATTGVRHTSYRYNSTAGKFILADSQPPIEEGVKYFITFNCNTANGTPKIVDGKLTDNWVSPVVMSGYVPDLLKSISMVSDDFEISGLGHCGKGYKEWVRVSDGGPALKVRVKLG